MDANKPRRLETTLHGGKRGAVQETRAVTVEFNIVPAASTARSSTTLIALKSRMTESTAAVMAMN